MKEVQADNWPDTVQLTTFTLKAKTEQLKTAFFVKNYDALSLKNTAYNSIADLLANQGNVLIRSYGPGNLATASIRGNSAAHTKILWNGLNIESPMLGQMDLSGLPSFFADELNVYEGGSSLLTGAGGLGGSIDIQNDKDWKANAHSKAGFSFGSFGEVILNGDVQASKANFLSRTRLQHTQAENQFPYKDVANNQTSPSELIREDAWWNQTTLMQEFSVRDSSINRFSANVWLQSSERGLPSPIIMTSLPGNESLKQKFARSILTWNHNHKSGKFDLKTAWFYDVYEYQNRAANILSESQFNSFIFNYSGEHSLQPAIQIRSQAEARQNLVQSSEYSDTKQSTQLSLMLAANVQANSRLEFDFILRSEWLNTYSLQLLPAIAARIGLLNNGLLDLRVSASGNSRFPTMNDLYWVPGGNPDLIPEKSFSSDIGLTSTIKRNENSQLNISVNAYYSNVDDWIQWQPDSVFNYWKPFNIKQVETYGVEINPDYTCTLGKITIKTGGNYTLRFSKDISSNPLQLMYIPRHTANAQINVGYQKIGLGWDYSYTGKRYTTADNQRFLPEYFLNNFHLSYFFTAGEYTISTNFHCLNVLNSDYHSIAWQPMPGRQFRISFLFTLPLKP